MIDEPVAAATASGVISDPDRAVAIWSPGRVNLIGDHIDYSGGLVLPFAIDRGTTAVLAPRDDELIRGFSTNFRDAGIVASSLSDAAAGRFPDGWLRYVVAMVEVARRQGLAIGRGFDIWLSGDIPAGGGLSSSASVEMAVATAVERLFDVGLTPTQWAVLGQRAENDIIGVASGIMDQLAIALGRADSAMLLDCATLQCEYVPFPSDRCAVVIANSRHRRQLADSAYNERRAAVARADGIVRRAGAASLIAADDQILVNCAPTLTAASALAEARHTVTEQRRVLAAADALRAGDLATVGELLRQSHESLRDDFQVTGAQLDALAEAAWATPGVIGARMTGAGFGGCTVNLVEPAAVDSAAVEIAERYQRATGVEPEVFAVGVSAGASVR